MTNSPFRLLSLGLWESWLWLLRRLGLRESSVNVLVRVLDLETKSPLREAQVTVFTSSGPSRELTAARGRASLRVPRQTEVSVWAKAPGHLLRQARLLITGPGQAIDVLVPRVGDVQLHPSC